MKGRECMEFKNYEIIRKESLDEIKSEGYLLRHIKSGARIVLISNDDENKVFSIGFRTPPDNSKGIQHIIEHSVLCGSKKYTAKDPFVELVKGSLNTFLNAITYSDKTLYPIASYNDKDFQNLMSIYVDAVFNPSIYDKKQIFMQEGWHYELENADDELKYNGVVYNEMKGAYSSPDELISKIVFENLFPDTAYSKDSGGDPKEIPNLTYEEFLSYHKTHYHPSNSYIYLYGDMDMEEKLKFLDEEYLSKYDAIDIDTTIKAQKGFGKMKKVKGNFAVTKGDTDTKSKIAYSVVCDTALNKELSIAMDILAYVLFSAQGAPVRTGLIEAGIASDVYASYQNMYQPVFSIQAEDVNEEDFDKFITVLRTALEEVRKNGIDKNAMLGYINALEFRYRENDFGRYPKGLIYGIQLFDRWLYEDGNPFITLQNEETIAFLKANIDTGYFEDLIEKYLLSEEHCVAVLMSPKEGLDEEEDNRVKEKLAKYKSTLTQQEIEDIIETTKQLKKYQEEPSTKEELATIPTLKREDIKKNVEPFNYEIRKVDDVEVVFSNVYTNEIGYLKLAFDTKYVPQELIPYITLLKTVLTNVDTDKHTYYDLRNDININTGALSTNQRTYVDQAETDKYIELFEFSSKVLYNKLPYVFDIIDEIINTSKLDDEKRLCEILNESKTRLQSNIVSNSTLLAVRRALSYMEQKFAYDELTEGVGLYEFINDLQKNFETKKAEIIANLKLVSKAIFKKENLIVSYTADEEGYKELPQLLSKFVKTLNKEVMTYVPRQFKLEQKNEGFMIASQVQSVAKAGNFKKKGFEYTGVLQIARVMLDYDFGWINIRLKGGAYGCMSEISRAGTFVISSYRDPNLVETCKIYDEIEEYFASFEADEDELTKYVIGTISDKDIPLNPSAKGNRDFVAYISHTDISDLQKERDQILNVTSKDIKDLAPMFASVIKDNNLCVFGNEAIINNNKEIFKEIKSLVNEA